MTKKESFELNTFTSSPHMRFCQKSVSPGPGCQPNKPLFDSSLFGN